MVPRVGREIPPGEHLANVRDDFVRRVADAKELEVVARDLSLSERLLTKPAEEPGPIRRAEQDDREVQHLASLDERERLEQLVERAEAPGEDHETLGVLHEHGLSHEEIAEVDPEVDVGVQLLLERELDVAADGETSGLAAAAVGRLHHARPAAGDDRESRPSELGA